MDAPIIALPDATMLRQITGWLNDCNVNTLTLGMRSQKELRPRADCPIERERAQCNQSLDATTENLARISRADDRSRARSTLFLVRATM
jgi:hypothetical protein